jgi:hypothetical protein
VLFDFYMDESSDEQRKRYWAVGGLNAAEPVWTQFEIRWLSRTYELKKPFRSTECENQKGQFASWIKADCDQLMADLVGIILEYRIAGLGWVVPIPEYASIIGDPGEYAGYLFALKCTLITSAILAERFRADIRFWIEENKATAARAKQVYQGVKAIKRWRAALQISGVHFSGKQIVGLQAADLMARESFKFMDNRGTGRKIRKPLLRLERAVTVNCWNKESLETFRDHGKTDQALIEFLAGNLTVPPIKLNEANY